MLCQIDYFWHSNLARIVTRHLHVHSYIFVAYFWGELRIIDVCVVAPIALLLKLLQFFAHYFFVLELAIVLLTFVFRSLLPAVHVETVSKHQNKLNHCHVVVFIDLGGALSEVDWEKLVAIKHIFVRFAHIHYFEAHLLKFHFWSCSHSILRNKFLFILVIGSSRSIFKCKLHYIVIHGMLFSIGPILLRSKQQQYILSKASTRIGRPTIPLLILQEQITGWI